MTSKFAHLKATTIANIARGDLYDVRIDRQSIFGNPFYLRRESERDLVLAKYRKYFYDRVSTDSAFRTAVLALRGLKLGCWCAGKGRCHGEVIVEWLEANKQ